MWGRAVAILIGAVLASGAPAGAGKFSSGSTGADGAFTASCTPTPCTQTIQLPALGIFNYTTYTVPANITVKYLGNATNTPVTILVSFGQD